MGLVLGSLENKDKIERFLYLLRSTSITPSAKTTKIYIKHHYIEKKDSINYSAANTRVWTSGSNLQQNSASAFFWYDSNEPLSKEILADLKSNGRIGSNCILAHMWVCALVVCIKRFCTGFYFDRPSNNQVKWISKECSDRNLFFCEIPKLCHYETCKNNKLKRVTPKARGLSDCLKSKCSKCKSVR